MGVLFPQYKAPMEKSTALDVQIQHKVWDAVIPIELKLAEDDLATPVAPDPYYVRCPYSTENVIFIFLV